MRIVFSRDRPAQLDLLLESIDRHMPASPMFTQCICHASTNAFRSGYALIERDWANLVDVGGFDEFLRYLLAEADETVTFFCDDDIVIRPVPVEPAEILLGENDMLSFSLRLGCENRQMDRPYRFPVWTWTGLPRHDFGYPASIDGNTFRTQDVLEMLGNESVNDPTMLETVLAMRCEQRTGPQPLMGSFWNQCLVGVPVNRVSPSSGVANGRVFPQTTKDLNTRFLDGYRIDFDTIDFSDIDDVHWEIMYPWAPA